MAIISSFPPPNFCNKQFVHEVCFRLLTVCGPVESTCGEAIMNGVWKQTHGRTVPLLPEEITIGSKEAALGMWGIPDFVFSRQGGHPEGFYRWYCKAPHLVR